MNRAIVSWCLYDLANTVFAMNMTSYHFPVWIVSDLGGSQLAYGLVFGGSMLLSGLLMPWLGRRSDRQGRRLPGLVLWTVVCVACTAALGSISGWKAALGLFALANVAYQWAGVYYNALLPTVADPGRLGAISGAGVAWGYVGTLLGIAVATPFVAQAGRQAAFLPTAVLFLALALPSFLFIRESSGERCWEAGRLRRWGNSQQTRSAAQQWRSHVQQSSVEHDGLKGFLYAAFWGLCAVSVVILFMAVYAKEAVGLSDRALQGFLVASTVAAIGGALSWGKMAGRVGGYRTLWWVWAVWSAAFGLAAATFHPAAFWIAGTLAGAALGGTWVACRVFLVEWVGPEKLGEAFGLFGWVSRLAAVAGPLVWGGLLWGLAPLGQVRYRLAILTLLLMVLAGWRLYHRLERLCYSKESR